MLKILPSPIPSGRSLARRSRARIASFTVDVEQDCPPFLETCRGMTEGMPALLDLLAELQVRATFFTTGEMARRFPDIVARVVADGHELGCHGDLHLDFTQLTRAEANAELRSSLETLRAFAPVVSFRAPYLRFPPAYLPLLVRNGLNVDSSVARYKFGEAHHPHATVAELIRVPASVTSSVLRLPRMIRTTWIRATREPYVLFVHPWEAADFRRSALRWDCRFRTGRPALRVWRDAITGLQQRGVQFLPLDELVFTAVQPAT
ncbi:MAG TPA: polysaccharide deacetylase family protein [Opitutaceae bacterium]|nr:polysaccharide deacetylase family protein [Opitutaceae bacterium]